MNQTTELVFILDRSGSMAGLESDTIGGFNSMLTKQKKLPGKAYVSTVLFSSSSEVLHDRLDLDEIAPMSENDYSVGGSTALIDAIGGSIRHISNIHKYARKEDVPQHTIFVITTDGMENASHHYRAEQVRKMIREKEEQCGWTFLFLAANIDAAETAEHIGIRRNRSANYRATCEGTGTMFNCVTDCISTLRCDRELDDEWASALKIEDN